ncbi:MAG TPA: AraC family transcriptional regulator [Verrucomicrobiae bacterium]|nr:AraC family transcriptional regulator [Verrucomicrobiae bacterium]
MPDDRLSAPRHLDQDEAPVTTPKLRVEIDPPTAATRSEASWPGLAAEVVHITASGPFKCGFSASCHLLMSVDRGTLVHGESRVQDVIVSTRRDIGRTLSFIPKGYVFHGTFLPLTLPWGGNLYIDPAMSLADPELRLDDIEFEPRLFFDEPALWTTASKILRLVEEGDDNRLYAETLTAALAIELVRFRSRGGLRPPAERGGLAEWQRRAVLEFINDNLDRNISLKELASLVRLSPNHLCRAFARAMGMPPHQYHRRQRIERAKLLLADTHRSITDVVSATGYTASSNFATAFRRVTGLSPREFRRTLL